MATYPIRPVAEDELTDFLAVDQHASHGTPTSERARANLLARLDFGRTLAAFDGDTIVGSAGAFGFQMRVPGALAAVAGVSLVAVLPSHRRQGILSVLMRRQLADVSERGEAVAVLFCSESGIYGRYGYGRASWHAAYRLQRGEGTLAPGAPADPGLRLRIAEPLSVRAELAQVYDAALAERPGMYARTEPWWDRLLTDLHSDGEPSRQIRCVLAEDDSGPRGYAVFTSAERWDDDAGLPEGVLEVSEAITTDSAATAALWDNLLSQDLVSEFRARMRPVDDPLLYLLADPRRVRSLVSDGLWVRLVDVGSALAQRHYACPVDVVIEVADELCPHNAGRWRLAAEAGRGGWCRSPGLPRYLRTDHHPGRCGTARLGSGRRVPRRQPPWAHGQGGPGHRGDAGFPRGALQRHVVGTGTLVPHDLLTWTGGRERHARQT